MSGVDSSSRFPFKARTDRQTDKLIDLLTPRLLIIPIASTVDCDKQDHSHCNAESYSSEHGEHQSCTVSKYTDFIALIGLKFDVQLGTK